MRILSKSYTHFNSQVLQAVRSGKFNSLLFLWDSLFLLRQSVNDILKGRQEGKQVHLTLHGFGF